MDTSTVPLHTSTHASAHVDTHASTHASTLPGTGALSPAECARLDHTVLRGVALADCHVIEDMDTAVFRGFFARMSGGGARYVDEGRGDTFPKQWKSRNADFADLLDSHQKIVGGSNSLVRDIAVSEWRARAVLKGVVTFDEARAKHEKAKSRPHDVKCKHAASASFRDSLGNVYTTLESYDAFYALTEVAARATTRETTTSVTVVKSRGGGAPPAPSPHVSATALALTKLGCPPSQESSIRASQSTMSGVPSQLSTPCGASPGPTVPPSALIPVPAPAPAPAPAPVQAAPVQAPVQAPAQTSTIVSVAATIDLLVAKGIAAGMAAHGAELQAAAEKHQAELKAATEAHKAKLKAEAEAHAAELKAEAEAQAAELTAEAEAQAIKLANNERRHNATLHAEKNRMTTTKNQVLSSLGAQTQATRVLLAMLSSQTEAVAWWLGALAREPEGSPLPALVAAMEWGPVADRINVELSDGSTLLTRAVLAGDRVGVHVLLGHGARADVPDARGRRAADLTDDPEVLHLLESAAAEPAAAESAAAESASAEPSGAQGGAGAGGGDEDSGDDDAASADPAPFTLSPLPPREPCRLEGSVLLPQFFQALLQSDQDVVLARADVLLGWFRAWCRAAGVKIFWETSGSDKNKSGQKRHAGSFVNRLRNIIRGHVGGDKDVANRLMFKPGMDSTQQWCIEVRQLAAATAGAKPLKSALKHGSSSSSSPNSPVGGSKRPRVVFEDISSFSSTDDSGDETVSESGGTHLPMVTRRQLDVEEAATEARRQLALGIHSGPETRHGSHKRTRAGGYGADDDY